ncbi:hypothetical protein GCM10007977_039220 [Dactylosporangium sucinum]|uniref:Secreted protein n=2 Tax=Dactylosporangium sucinum TaxID=1424081 RepID=A0A917WVP5_9ACTN|nr:hypothetical protein GCM10007977_039220 [Dactylosporangium sucinum]
MATPPPDDPNANGPKGRMEPTRPATLAIAALAMTAVSWIVISNFWNSMPTLPWLPPLTLIGLAIFEGFEAYSTRARILRKEGAGPLNPLVTARYAVLGKASALVAALFGGVYIGMSTWLLTQRGVLAKVSENLPQALLGVAASIVLVAAALWLERACRVPPGPRDGEQPRQGRQEPLDRAEDDQVA